MMRTIVHIVPHTHWDREWYEPFEGYRFRLVKTLDRLLDILETDPHFRHFNFDGQTAAIEDYLAVRPDAAERVRTMVAGGRMAIGPWRILMDEFLCSPETIIRNLSQGARSAASLGRVMRIGYIPDSFGHVAQMPQILRLAGLTDAMVWRGVPRSIERTAFWWEAPDGSRVRTMYLATSYSNSATLPDSVSDFVARARRIAADLRPFTPGNVLLAMNGSDHLPPQSHLPDLVAGANAAQDELEFRIGSLEEYAAVAPSGDELPVWRGELRSGARANLLPGVASARMPLKQAEFAASALLERYAEPLQALAGTDTGDVMDAAWRRMVENSAHDSICGCGIDAVADQVHARYREATRIARLVADDALAALATRVDTSALPASGDGVVVFNPSPRAREGGAVEVTLVAPGDPESLAFRAPDGSTHAAQVIESQEQVAVDMTLRGSQLARIVPTIHSRAIGGLYVNSLRVEYGSTTTVRMRLGPVTEGAFDVEAAKSRVEDEIRRRPHGKFRVLGVGPPLCRALARAPSIDGLGWTLLEPVSAGGTRAPNETVGHETAARADGHVIDNGILRAEVDADGRVCLIRATDGTRFEELLGIEDGGDAGDEYNYSPPDADEIVTQPAVLPIVEEASRGPVEAALRILRRYRIPAELRAGGRARARRTIPMDVITTIALRAGEPFLRARIEIANGATDHRVRAIFPLPFASTRSHADGAFVVDERGLVAEGGAHEAGMPTFPCRRWVDVSDGTTGLAILHRGTPEYEVAGGRAIAITLLRCVGWLSRQGMATRAGPAGPALATPGAQLIGDHAFDVAIYPHAGDWRTGDVHDVAERFAYPLTATTVRAHAGELPSHAHGLWIEPGSVQLSAFAREDGALTCRVCNACPEAVVARLAFGPALGVTTATRAALWGDDGDPIAVDDGVVTLPMRAWEIATLRAR